MKYYVTRVLASFFCMVSFAVGFLVGAKSGLLFGVVSCCGVLALGLYFDSLARKIKKNEV